MMMLNIWKDLIARRKLSKNAPDLTNTTKANSGEYVSIRASKNFTDLQSGAGNYLPEEYEEEIVAILPKRATPGSAGIDLRAHVTAEEGILIPPGGTALIPTGFEWLIPSGNVGLVCSRSGMALKNQVFVLNAPGIIDSDYRGEVGVILFNAGKQAFQIMNGDRIAQMVVIQTANLPLLRVEPTDGKSISMTEVYDTTIAGRGQGGFGSTGKG